MRIISLDRGELLAALHLIAGQIQAAHSEVIEVRLFGSIARSDQTGTSDADILIVLREPCPDPLEQARNFYRYFNLPIGVDLLVLDRDQIMRRQQAGDPFVQQICRESIAL